MCDPSSVQTQLRHGFWAVYAPHKVGSTKAIDVFSKKNVRGFEFCLNVADMGCLPRQHIHVLECDVDFFGFMESINAYAKIGS
ncbi:NADH dehydrogenase subunit A [Rhodobacterales bacterium HTCC2150]|nr:NADH dehydrogenase subunit A [Rhodobacterales bacterium HTCC2150] [Rhodobacteraceae bacterium HTCC2150]